jgi:hypothetical protein
MAVDYLCFDEQEDVVATQEHCAHLTDSLSATPANWKWFLVALHNALQGALVCTQSRSATIGALSTQSQKKWFDYHERSRTDSSPKPPKRILADLLELYERSKRPEWMSVCGGSPLWPALHHHQSVRHLHDLRNNFMHFAPMGWWIEFAGIPSMVLNIQKS